MYKHYYFYNHRDEHGYHEVHTPSLTLVKV